MRLTVRLFAVLRERAGAAELALDDCPEDLDLAGLKALLVERHPELGSLDYVRGVVGTEYVADDRRLAANEEVALLPPVSGGTGRADPSEDPDSQLERGLFELSAEPIDPASCARRVEHPSCGAVVTFAGNVRDQARGQEVVHLAYEAFEEMTAPEMGRIFADCRAALGESSEGAPQPAQRLRMLCVHRVGQVGVGEPSVVIAVASPHRAAAFQAARFLIDELKARLPIWKKEVYADGHHWVAERS